jgi:hypothetical protein
VTDKKGLLTGKTGNRDFSTPGGTAMAKSGMKQRMVRIDGRQKTSRHFIQDMAKKADTFHAI